MTTWRKYSFSHDGEWSGDTESVEVVLTRQSQRHWWYQDPVVQGEAYNRLQFSFVVAGRDQWWCHQRAMWLASVAYVAAGVSPNVVPTPTWVTPPPHSNRGRARKSAAPV
jgi:hypothetical protein